MVNIPSNAPFSPEQIGWLNGYLAARSQAMGGASNAATSAPEPSLSGAPVTILWGSQTGNSEGLAKQAGKTLTASGHQVTITDMGEADASALTETENLLIITSTYGDGEPPDNAQALHELLHSDEAPQFEKTAFSVLGLGDSEYPDFNQCAKEFDSALEKLGATRLAPLIESDVDYDEPFDQFVSSVSTALAQ